MLYVLVKLMKLYISCQINSFVDFQYQVYPKCVASQCDVIRKTLQDTDGNYCMRVRQYGDGGSVIAEPDMSMCSLWSYSCEFERVHTRDFTDGGNPIYLSADLSLVTSQNTKLYMIPDSENDNQFQLATREANTCLALNNGLYSFADCEKSQAQLFKLV